MLNFRDLASITVDAIREVQEEATTTPDATTERSQEQQRDEKVREHFDYMVDNTSFHGVNYIIDERHPLRRILWLVITLSAFVYSMLKVYESFQEYFEYPFETAVMRKHVDELVFPAVSICNLNDLRLSKMTGTLLDRAIFNETLWKGVTTEHYKVTEHAPHKIDEMLVECIFDGEECSHKNFSEFRWSQGDRCFTFNSGKVGHKLVSVRGAGVSRGLMLTLNIQHYDYYRDATNSGVHLILHGQDQTPVKIQGPIIPPSFATYVKLDKRLTINLEPPYKTKCGSRKLRYHKKYSMDACWLEQLTEFVVKECQCKEAFMPGNFTECSLTQLYLCLWRKWEDFERERLYNCPLPCEIEQFSYSTSRALFPSQSYAQELKNKIGHLAHVKEHLSKAKDVTGFMRNNILRLIIFYEDLSYVKQEQQPSYDLAFFLGDVGGQIGLFVGAGAMSYFEILDCLGMVLHARFLQTFS